MSRLTVYGYTFENGRDAKLATKEEKAIHKLQESIDISNTQSVYETYNKLVSKRYFSTPVGMSFLHEMRDYLKEHYSEEELKPIYVSDKRGHNEEHGLLEMNYKQLEKLKDENQRLTRIKQRLTIALVSLIIIIVGMVFIVITNDNLGYFNAEEKVLNKYAAWQERLEGWEDELIRREAELEK